MVSQMVSKAVCKDTLHFCKAVNMDSVYLNPLSLRDITLSGGTSALLGPVCEIVPIS